MRKISTAAIAGALAVPAAGSGVGAAPNTGVIATYNGRQINLAESWEGAQACVQYTVGDVRCYDSRSDVKDALVQAARLPSGAEEASPLTCSGGGLVTLFSDIGNSGTSVSFGSTGGWANLAPYGFNDDMESWTNGTGCNAQVADGTLGNGDRLTLAAHSSSSNVGTSWKNRASSVNAQ